MTELQSEKVALSYLDLWKDPDIEQIMALFDDDAIYADMRTIVQGKASVRGEMENQIAAVGSTEPIIVNIASSGNTAFIERLEHISFGGKAVTVEGAMVFEVNSEGLISRLRDYYTTTTV